MMAGSQLAQLFVDITMRGGGKVDLKKFNDLLKEADKSLANNASLYQRQSKAKLDQLDLLARKQAALSQLDYKTYGSQRYANYMKTQVMANRQSAIAAEMANYQQNVAQRGGFSAVMRGLGGRLKSGETQMGFGGGAMGVAGSVAGAVGAAAQAAAPIAAAVAGVFYASLRAASSASDNASSLLSGSWKMLTNEIGTMLLPVLVEFSRALQWAAQKVREFRENGGGRVVATGAGVVGGAMVGGAVAGPVGAIIGGVVGGIAGFFAGRGNGGPMLASSNAQAGFSSIEGAWKRVQSEAASGGSLEAQQLAQQIESNRLLSILTGQGAPQNQPQPGNVP